MVTGHTVTWYMVMVTWSTSQRCKQANKPDSARPLACQHSVSVAFSESWKRESENSNVRFDSHDVSRDVGHGQLRTAGRSGMDGRTDGWTDGPTKDC